MQLSGHGTGLFGSSATHRMHSKVIKDRRSTLASGMSEESSTLLTIARGFTWLRSGECGNGFRIMRGDELPGAIVRVKGQH
jgi:hypothetical protein